MKKSLVVLLIAVLAVSSVFAGISGYVDAKYEVDFDNGLFGYSKPQLGDNLIANLVFEDLIGEKKGDGKAYIDAKASLTWTTEDFDNHDGKRVDVNALGFFKFNLDKATIVGKNWSINLLEAEELGNFAASTLDSHTWYRHDHMRWGGVNDGDDMSDYLSGLSAASQNKKMKELVKINTKADGKVDFSEYDGSKQHSLLDTEGDKLVGLENIVFDKDYSDYAKKVAYGVGIDYFGDDDDMYGITATYDGWKVALALNGGFEAGAQKRFAFGVQTKEFEIGDFTAQAAAEFSYRRKTNEQVKETKPTGTDIVIDGVTITGEKEIPSKTDFKSKDNWVIGASFKAAYKTDKFSASVATDHVIETKGIESDDRTPIYKGDVLATIDFAPVSATVFFGKDAKSNKGYDKSWSASTDGPTKSYKYYFSKQGKYKENVIKNLFSFQIGLDLNTFDIPVALKFQALNMLAESRIFNVEAKLGFIENVDITVYGKDLLASIDRIGTKKCYTADDGADWLYWKENGNSQKLGVTATWKASDALTVNGEAYFKLGAEDIGANVGATYVAEMFTASASVDTVFDYNKKNADKNDEQHKMQIIAEVKSDKLVDGAVLSLKYESGNILDTTNEYDWYVGRQSGSLTAKCRITF